MNQKSFGRHPSLSQASPAVSMNAIYLTLCCWGLYQLICSHLDLVGFAVGLRLVCTAVSSAHDLSLLAGKSDGKQPVEDVAGEAKVS